MNSRAQIPLRMSQANVGCLALIQAPRGCFAPIGDALGARDRIWRHRASEAARATRAAASIVRCAVAGIGAAVEEGLSAIAGVSYFRFYFRLFPGSIKSPQIVEFLKALSATTGKKMLIIWDRLQAHRSVLVREYIEAQRGAIALEFLPAYAPELNPVECIWGYLKSHAMPNFCARDLTHLKRHASSRLRSMQRRSSLVTAFLETGRAVLIRHPFNEVSIVRAHRSELRT